MKFRSLASALALSLCLSTQGKAQSHEPPPPTAALAEMRKLDFLLGTWKGDSWIVMGPAGKTTAHQTETVTNRLGGLILVIDGLGMGRPPGAQKDVPVHEAFAVVSWDDAAKFYRVKAYTKDGRSIDAESRLVEPGLFEWGFTIGPRKIRYRVKLDDQGRWFEIGEMSMTAADGTASPWQKFLEMTLTRQPAAK